MCIYEATHLKPSSTQATSVQERRGGSELISEDLLFVMRKDPLRLQRVLHYLGERGLLICNWGYTPLLLLLLLLLLRRWMGRTEGTRQILSADHLHAFNNREKLSLSMREEVSAPAQRQPGGQRRRPPPGQRQLCYSFIGARKSTMSNSLTTRGPTSKFTK